MQILIGHDLVHIPRLRKAINRWGIERFCKRILTVEEINLLSPLHFENQRMLFVAGRIAAKEALFKAYSPIDRLGWRDFSILKLNDGRPNAIFNHPRDGWKTEISISHDGEYASATAIVFKTS